MSNWTQFLPGNQNATTGITPPQFDNSNKLATTEFANAQGLHFTSARGTAIGANTTLSPAQSGSWFEVQVPGVTVTLPPLASAPAGLCTYTFRAPYSFTLRGSGSESINNAQGTLFNALQVAAGDVLTVVSNGTGSVWVVVANGNTLGTGTTPPQFDNSTKLATTAFVQRAAGNLQGTVAVSGNTVLDQSYFGKYIEVLGANGVTITLPALSASSAGGKIVLYNGSAGNIAVKSGDSASISGPASSGGILTYGVRKNGVLTLISTGNQWREINSHGPDLLQSNGYKVIDGLIFQWGVYETTSNGANQNPTIVNFPIAFPTAVLNIQLTPLTQLWPGCYDNIFDYSLASFRVYSTQGASNGSSHGGFFYATGF